MTGQLARVDLLTGTAHIVNAGHPLPWRVRAGRVTPVPLPADLPFGVATSAAAALRSRSRNRGSRR